MTIPASQIVQINPGVINSGGNALALNGVILTNNSAVPIGDVMPFPSASAVGAFFGLSSVEYLLASQYFLGYENSTQTPGNIFFSQYSDTPVSGYLRGASTGSMTLAQLQAFSGTISLTVAGTVFTSSSINLSAATSFSEAATLIQAGFTSPTFSVTYDAIRQAFLFTTTATGATETITYASGTLATDLLLTQALGAVTSQGAAGMTPATAMPQITTQTLNWGGFTTAFNPTTTDKEGFAQWVSGQNHRFTYVMWDNNVAATVYPDTTTALASILTAGYADVCPVYCDATIDPNGITAAFVLGTMASINFSQKNGRITFAFKYQSGVPVSVTNQTIAADLELNGYNFVGAYATANQGFTFFYPGSVTGPYSFLDELVNEIYLNSQLQLALMELLIGVPDIPYNAAGYALIRAACADPIDQALNFGAIRAGVPLSALQAAEVNNAAGLSIDKTLSSVGYYLQILPATAQVRGARGTPPINFWYMDGGAVQKISMSSIVIQ